MPGRGPRRRVAAALGLALAVAAGALVAAFASGARLDLSRWRDALAGPAGAALGRPVAPQGPLTLQLGQPLQLHLRDLHIANPPGFDPAGLLHVGEATLRIDAWQALRGRLQLRGIEARDLSLRLERRADGHGNWQFGPGSGGTPDIDLGPVRLQDLRIRLHDQRSGLQQALVLDTLSAMVSPQAPLQLALQGNDDAGQPFRLQAEGGSLQAFQQGATDWPFRIDVAAAAGWLQAQGLFDALHGGARFRLGAGAGRTVPDRVVLSADALASVDGLALNGLQGRVGEAALSGQLQLAWAARPRLSGALHLQALDLRPWLPAEADAASSGWAAQPLRAQIPLDLDLALSVGRWDGLPLPLADARLRLRAEGQRLQAPLQARVNGTALSGQLDLDLGAAMPSAALQLDAQEVPLAGWGLPVPALQGLEGRLGQVQLRLASRGDTARAWLAHLAGALSLQDAQGRLFVPDAADALDFRLDALQLQAAPGQPLRGEARGALRGRPTQALLRAGTLAEMTLSRRWPIDLQLSQPQAQLRVQALIDGQADGALPRIGFELQAQRAGDLARWLPVAAGSTLPLRLAGEWQGSAEAWTLQRGTLAIGRSELQAQAQQRWLDGRPRLSATLRSPLIDGPELATLFERGTPAPAGAALLDAPWLADRLWLPDADLDLFVQQLALRRMPLQDLSFVARSRDGQLLPSPLRGRLAGAPFEARLGFDARGAMPQASLSLQGQDVDVGQLLRTLGVAEDIDGQAALLQLDLQARGRTLRELATHTALQARLDGGQLRVQGPAQRPAADIGLQQARIDAPAGQPVQVDLQGRLGPVPLRLQLRTGSFAELAGDATRVPLELKATAAGTTLALDGEVMLPLGSAGQLRFALSGERLDSLNTLAQAELPAWGPWSLSGPIGMTADGYVLQGLVLAVGQSRLEGSGRLDLSGPRPRAELRVHAPRIQLDDFPPPTRLTDDPPVPAPTETPRGTAARTAEHVDRLLSARFLRRFDAQLQVQADEVLSGADRLADGALRLTLQQGRLDLDPAVLNLPGGGMRLSMSYDLKQSEVDFHVAAQVERFDYGIIARRLQRANDLRGLFSLNLYLAGRAPSLDAMLTHASGQLDVAVWPTELRSGVFNLWSANLVLALLPLIDPGQQSQVNCIIGRFDLHDGGISDDLFLIDTRSVRIRGSGQADLRNDRLAFVFRPRAKGPGLFRLQTPLRVTGTLSDQRFGFDTIDVFSSGLRMVASPILVPIERLRLGPLPRDGADVCTAPLRRPAAGLPSG